MNIIYGAIFEEEVEVVVDESDAGEATTYYFTLVLLLQYNHSNDSHQCPILAADLLWDRK